MCEFCREIEARKEAAQIRKNKYYTVLTLSLNEHISNKDKRDGMEQTNIKTTATIKYCPKCGRRIK